MMLLIVLFFISIAERQYVSHPTLDQGSALFHFRLTRTGYQVPAYVNLEEHYDFIQRSGTIDKEPVPDDHFIIDGLPGQPASGESFKQFAGTIEVDQSNGRTLFYYFVESCSNSSEKPLILWLNGGPGCSSVGMGAFSEIGPFGVNPDGQTLYARVFAWNQVANLLFLESPVTVGFSYSNTTSDYDLPGDKRTAEDTYVFLIKWFGRYKKYMGRDFYLMGESYAGHYIPELADIILARNSTPMINVKGIMIGNGLMDDVHDTKGMIDYGWSHALLSSPTRATLHQSCSEGSIYETPACGKAIEQMVHEIGNLDYLNIYGPLCNPPFTIDVTTGSVDPCELLYVRSYLNLPQVQGALNVDRTTLPYTWEPCTVQTHHIWLDSPSSMFPIYKRLIGHGLRILLYSGDVDTCVPVTSSRYSLEAMDLKVIKPWSWWSIDNTSEVAGYNVVYDGLSYATVRGGGHEVSRSQPRRLFAILNKFLNNSML